MQGQSKTRGVPRLPWCSPNSPTPPPIPNSLRLPLHPGPAGPPLLPLTVLHLDNTASGHLVGGDKDIIGALDADEVLHSVGKPRGQCGTLRLLGLPGETARPNEDFVRHRPRDRPGHRRFRMTHNCRERLEKGARLWASGFLTLAFRSVGFLVNPLCGLLVLDNARFLYLRVEFKTRVGVKSHTANKVPSTCGCQKGGRTFLNGCFPSLGKINPETPLKARLQKNKLDGSPRYMLHKNKTWLR